MALISDYIYGVIVFVLLIGGGFFFLADLRPGDVEVGVLNESFNKQAELSESIGRISDSLDTKPDAGLFGFLDSLINAAWDTLSSFGDMFSFMDSVFGSVGDALGIPGFIMGLLGFFAVVIIVLTIYGAFFRKDI